MAVVLLEAPGWELEDELLKGWLIRAVELAVLAGPFWLTEAERQRGPGPPEDAEVSLLLTGDDGIRELNHAYRGLDRATDVLAFPQWEPEELAALVRRGGMKDGAPVLLGDVVISLERARDQAALYGHPFGRELCFLGVHGALHLLGYDHHTPEEEAVMMARADVVMNALGFGR